MDIVSLVIFTITIILIITHEINRATAAILGAVIMIMAGVFPDQIGAFKEYIDFNTIFLLLGMMIFVSVIKRSGFFTFLGIKTLTYAGKNGFTLFFSLTFLVAVTSAFIDNVTTILIFIPITLTITDSIEADHMPYILGEIFASNIGGTATIIGDPPNIMISSAAGMNFMQFARIMTPVSLINLLFMQFIFFIIFKKQFSVKYSKDIIARFDLTKIIENKRKFYTSAFLFVTVIILFGFQRQIGSESCIIALFAGFLSLLLLEPVEISGILQEVELETLLFFVGLFILTGGLEQTGVLHEFSNLLIKTAGNSDQFFASFTLSISAIISGFIGPIPFTASMIPVLENLHHIAPDIFVNMEPQWFALAAGVCFGGNLTPIGAAANIVGLAMIKQFKNEVISFKKFTFYGAILVVGNIIISILFINLFLF